MAFGQPSGPPASAKQVRELLELLQRAGHTDFRDARGPMGFNQRQAAGKFTRDEADGYIAQLVDEQEQSSDTSHTSGTSDTSDKPATRTPTTASAPGAGAGSAQPARRSTADALRSVPSPLLAAELQRRGWVVMEP